MPFSSQDTPSLVSAIIVNWNTKNYLLPCLKAILSEKNEQIEIIVVDNNSSDGSAELVKRDFPSVVLVTNNKNLMFAGGVNSGLRVAKGMYCLILNPDIVITPAKIIELAFYLESHRDVVAVAPQLMYPDGTRQTEMFLRFPGLGQVIFYYTVLAPLARKVPFLRSAFYECSLDGSHESTVDQVPGACMMVPRRFIETVGGMDEDFTLYYEDVDWCKRLSRYGRCVAYTKLSVYHHHGGSHGRYDEWVYGRFRVSMLLYFKKHLGVLRYLTAKTILIASAMPGYVLRKIQKMTGLGNAGMNAYHLGKYRFFFEELKNRKPSFDKY
jgi:hypothetical protein